MKRYYFDFSRGAENNDDVGCWLPNVEAARLEALHLLPTLVAHLDRLEDHTALQVTVRDEAGRAVLLAKLSLEAQWLG
ncbi:MULTISPECIES: DUF6894 family protein [Lichenihabitans]|uniref:DUF6894 family protein n=1 Tax=Lichenihabitans TaxID=2723776 RepID=UPI0010356FB0|nr:MULTISPECIES: hypothetical protein [Lichenihabitans]UDL96176.1 hypothetical protein LGH83_08350 [Lichenihabitans sp. PAMC28606]